MFQSSENDFELKPKIENFAKVKKATDSLELLKNKIALKDILNKSDQSTSQPTSTPEKIEPKVEPVDKFIDSLIEGQETVLSESYLNKLDGVSALRFECETRTLPPIELRHFSGDSSKWPEFIENFKNRVHYKS